MKRKNNKLIVTINEIIDYNKCSLLWYLKYKRKDVKTRYVTLVEKYDDDIHKVIYQAYNKLQDEDMLRIEDIKTFWGKEWIKDKRRNSIMFSDTYTNKDIYNDKRRRGIDVLLNFYRNFISIDDVPILINYPCNININKNLILKSNIEVVNMNNDLYKNYVFKTNEHNNTQVLKDYEIKSIGNYIALKELLDSDNIDSYMFNIDKKSIYKMDITENDIKIFKHSIESVSKLIYNNIFYMIPSEKCDSCIYKDVCSNKELLNEIINGD